MPKPIVQNLCGEVLARIGHSLPSRGGAEGGTAIDLTPSDAAAPSCPAPICIDGLPLSGDADLGPSAWLWDPQGRMWKVGGHGAEAVDHTAVGERSILWAIGAFVVEWDVPRATAAAFASAIAQRLRVALPWRAVLFHCLTYAAFRIGQLSLTLGLTGRGSEQARVQAALAHAEAQAADLMTLL